MVARSFSFVVNAAFTALIVGAAVPGTHRVILPEAYGMTQIAPRVWSDAPQDSRRLVVMAEASRARVVRFFGDEPPRPTLVLCATKSCAQVFGIGGNGLSIADMTVMVSPGGLTKGTLTHEMTHSRLHRSMGLRNLVDHPFPTWFDEGLATYVAGHPRWPGRTTAEARARVRQTSHFWQWGDTMRELGVGRAYAAAAAEVAQMEALAGRSGLLELIARAEAGEDFEILESEITRR